MRIVIKELTGTTWNPLPIEKVLGTSVAAYMAESKKPIVAALFEEEKEKPAVFITNKEEYYSQYKEKGICFRAEEILSLFAENNPALPVIAEVFPGSHVSEVRLVR